MADPTYEVVFSGRIRAGLKPSVVKGLLRSRLKLSRRELQDLFSGEERVVKRTPDKDTAEEYARIFEEAGAPCRIRAEHAPEGSTAPRSLVTLGEADHNVEPAASRGGIRMDMTKTLKTYLHLPFQSNTGSWHVLRLRRPAGSSTRDLTAAAAAAVQRVTGGHGDPSARSYDISRVIGGSLMAIPTGGLAIGVGSALLLKGAWLGGLLNILLFGPIAAYGIWLVATGVRSARRRGEATAKTPTGGVALSDKDVGGSRRRDGADAHPGILSFTKEAIRMAEPCTYEYKGTDLWGTTKGRGCENISFLLSAVVACMAVGFWIPAFLKVSFVLVILLALALALSPPSRKPVRQFHLNLATEPPVWSSNDDEFWRPVMEFFGLRQLTERRSWFKRKAATGNGRKTRGRVA